MSTLKVNKLRDTAGSADAITLDPNGGAVLAGVTTVSTVKVGAAVTISESGVEATGVGITVANINGGQIGGRRNKIINGAMQVAQRGTSESSVTSSGYKQTPDRWRINLSGPTVTVSQSTDSPDGFSNSYKIDITTADTSISGSDRLILQTRLEGQDLQDFAKGTSSAKDFIVSFYCKSTKTGTFTVELEDNDNTGDGGARSVSRHFTISNTNWNRYVINFGADTTGAFVNDNEKSLTMFFWLMAGGTYAGGASLKDQWGAHIDNRRAYGTTNGADSTDNDFYFTGVQLEVGSRVTPYEHRSFGEELQLCSRYFQKIDGGGNSLIATGFTASNDFYGGSMLPMGKMRTAPTIAVDGTLSHLTYTHVAVSASASSISNQGSGDSSFVVRLQSTSGTTDNAGAYARITNSSTNLTFDAEI